MAKQDTSSVTIPTWLFAGFGIITQGTIHEISIAASRLAEQLFGGLL
jgi:hypothetical protein